MAQGDFNIEAKKEYVGEFTEVLQSIQKMNYDLNNTLKNINEASVKFVWDAISSIEAIIFWISIEVLLIRSIAFVSSFNSSWLRSAFFK